MHKDGAVGVFPEYQLPHFFHSLLPAFSERNIAYLGQLLCTTFRQVYRLVAIRVVLRVVASLTVVTRGGCTHLLRLGLLGPGPTDAKESFEILCRLYFLAQFVEMLVRRLLWDLGIAVLRHTDKLVRYESLVAREVRVVVLQAVRVEGAAQERGEQRNFQTEYFADAVSGLDVKRASTHTRTSSDSDVRSSMIEAIK